MLGSTWYDVIDRTDGSREIVFSTKLEQEALDKVDELHNSGHIVYIAHFQVEEWLKREIIDPYDGYVSYTVQLGIDEPTTPVKKKKRKSEPKKEYKF